VDCGGYFSPLILMYAAHSDFFALNKAVLITTSVIAYEVEYHHT
jgi:hypothetical protein